jgi:acyl carrier protein
VAEISPAGWRAHSLQHAGLVDIGGRLVSRGVTVQGPCGQLQCKSGGAAVATEDSSEVAVSDLDRRQATSVVFGALTAVMPDLQVDALTEQQELYADLGLDSLGFVRLLIELEGKLSVQLVDEELMTIELVTVADLVDLVENISLRAAK